MRIGIYYPFIADWLRVFPMEQVMVIRYEDYIAKPSELINNICKFLGIRKLAIFVVFTVIMLPGFHLEVIGSYDNKIAF